MMKNPQIKHTVTVGVVTLAVFLTACVNDRPRVSSRADESQPQVSVVVQPHRELETFTDTSHRQVESGVMVNEGISEQSQAGQLSNNQSSAKNQKLIQYESMRNEMAVASPTLSIAPRSSMEMPLDFYDHQPIHPTSNTENYLNFDENNIKLVDQQPVSTFSVDVDTASYSNVRRMLQAEGRLPPRDAVKVEEMINYFSYDYPLPDSLDIPFSISTETARSPWNPDRHLIQIGLKGYQPVENNRPSANLVFLIDVSGSMMDYNKLPLVKQSLRLLVNQMRHDDRIALVVYAGAAGLVLDSTPAHEKQKIISAIDMLQAGGSTNGGAGLQLAYNVAEQNRIADGINRVIIASDGDMNVGITDHEMLKDMIEKKRKSGVALTTLGFGAGNYNYALMEQLADLGNGNAAYIDSISEAQKVLVNEIQSTLLTIARDVKIQVEFNPSMVSQYRLIGYENRVLNRGDFRNDKVDAGDIGAGHTVTAFYEVMLVGSEDQLIPDLRYGNESNIAVKNNKTREMENLELAYVNLRYKQPEGVRSKETGQPIMASSILNSLDAASSNLKFAAAVAGFGQILRGGKFTGDWKLDNVIRLARESKGDDYHGYRSEFIRLVELTQSMEQPVNQNG